MLSIDDYPHAWDGIVNQENALGGGSERHADLLLFSVFLTVQKKKVTFRHDLLASFNEEHFLP